MRKWLHLGLLLVVVAGLTADRFTTSARLYMKFNKWKEAMKILLEGKEVNPTNGEIYLLLGDVYVHDRLYAQADSAYHRALEVDGVYVEEVKKRREGLWAPLVNRGAQEIRRAQQIQEIIELNSLEGIRDGLRGRKYGKVAEELRPLFTAHSSDLAQLRAALQAERAKSYRDALETFLLAIQINPEGAEAYINLGLAYSQLNRKEEARDTYLKVLAIDPQNRTVNLNLAAVYADLGQAEKSAEVYEQYLQYHPDDLEIRENLGALYVKIKQPEKASQVYAELMTREGLAPSTYFNAGVAMIQVQDFEKAAQAFQKVVAADSTDQEATEYLSIALLHEKRYTEALAQLERLVRINPDHAAGWNNLGVVYAQLGQREKAVEAFAKAEALEKAKP